LNYQHETKDFRQCDPLTLDQHIGVRIPGGQPILFNNFHLRLVFRSAWRLRPVCEFLRRNWSIEPIDPSDIGPGNQVSVGVTVI